MSQFTILTVCTGNICRSPLAEQLLRSALADLPVKVHSAGTRALTGKGMPEPAQQISAELGMIDYGDHVASDLTIQDVQEADLILAMAREHRSATVQFDPRATRKTFTVRELARVVGVIEDQDLNLDPDADVVERLRTAVEAAAMNRGMAIPAETPDDDDVVDPYKRSQKTYELSRDQLVYALREATLFLRRAVA